MQARKEAAEHAKDAAFQRDYEDVLAGLACGSGEGWHIMGETQGVLDHKQKIKSKKQVGHPWVVSGRRCPGGEESAALVGSEVAHKCLTCQGGTAA